MSHFIIATLIEFNSDFTLNVIKDTEQLGYNSVSVSGKHVV